jgi:RHS repeat-associated protein
VKIVEVSGGTATSTRQFIWSGDRQCELRDANSNITAQFFAHGESISGVSYYFDKDHLGSVREMTNGAGTIVWQQSFDPYGLPTTIVSSTAADFGFAGYYVHGRSGLNLTRARAYSPAFGRFISRDPTEELGGVNLYEYVANRPTKLRDPSGTDSGSITAPGVPGLPPVAGLPSLCPSCSGSLIPPSAIMPPGFNPSGPELPPGWPEPILNPDDLTSPEACAAACRAWAEEILNEKLKKAKDECERQRLREEAAKAYIYCVYVWCK